MKLNNSLLAFPLIVFLQLPAEAKNVLIYEALIESTPGGMEVVYDDKSGRTKQQKLTTYTYLTKDGKKVKLPYKIPHLRDDRPFAVKHPLLYMGATAAIGPLAGVIGGSASTLIEKGGVNGL
jgi:hypothetical protein